MLFAPTEYIPVSVSLENDMLGTLKFPFPAYVYELYEYVLVVFVVVRFGIVTPVDATVIRLPSPAVKPMLFAPT